MGVRFGCLAATCASVYFVREASSATASCPKTKEGRCQQNSSGKSSSQQASQEFWVDMRREGLEFKLSERMVKNKLHLGRAVKNRTAMVLSEDVFYGRAIMKVPRRALLSLETMPNTELRHELTDFLYEKRALERSFNVTSEDSTHLLSLAYPLIMERRNPHSVFKPWLRAAEHERMVALDLSERQQRALVGTTVEGTHEGMLELRDLIAQTSTNFSSFRTKPVTEAEAAWALAMVMRHARVVHPHQDVRETQSARMYLIPLVELLGVQLHPNPTKAPSFQEEIILEGKKERELVLQIARRDMPKDEEVFLWPGRLSNSEMAIRHGFMFRENPVGIGRNISQPPNWELNPKSKIRREYDKYECSTLESFEMRFSPQGLPMQNFVKCYRLSWLLTNGWYSPAYTKRLRDLTRWPPPKKYEKEDWLAMSQADAELNRVILEYCQVMRDRLKNSMDADTAKVFRSSTDPIDKLLWQVRSEESKTFKQCVKFAKKVRGLDLGSSS